MNIDPRPTLAAPDDDPYLWLEEIEGVDALAWVDRQNQATLSHFGGEGYLSDRARLAAIFDRPENIPYISRRGNFVYNFWQDDAQPRGIWRRTALASFRTTAPEWDVLLDLDALADDEGEDWTWQAPVTLPGRHDRAILRLSRGGGDAVVLREFDLTTRSFVDDGFALPEAKGSAVWVDRDALLLSSAHGEGMATRAGYARTVRFWRRGQAVDDAVVVFETGDDEMGVWATVDRHDADIRVWFTNQTSFFEAEVWFGDQDGPKTRLALPADADVRVHRNWLAVRLRSAWAIAGRDYEADTLLGIALEKFVNGDNAFQVLFQPETRRSLRYFFWCGDELVLAILDDLAPVFTCLVPGTGGWTRCDLDGLPKIAVAEVWPLDADVDEANGDLLASVQDPLTPPSLLLVEGGKAPAILKSAPAAFRADGLVVTRHEASSVDGERIPYVQVGPERPVKDAPVHLTGYGGFRISTLPYYGTAIGKLWLERGGTAVIANIRGGGEFGSRWHEAGRRAGKRLSHDDFAAVAGDLVARGVTRPNRIVAEGGSNGGILITNMLTRYPDRFGALFCTIPLVDMRRYTHLLAGASWIDEYGDPARADDWAFLQHYSAYHTAEPGRDYPPILLATTRRDDRVHPGHARKMAAKLQAMGYAAYFYEPAAGGHGYGKDNLQRAGFIALGYNFLRRSIGWDADD